MKNEDLVALTTDITTAYLSRNAVAADDVANLIEGIHGALASAGQQQAEEYEPAVSVRASVKPDHLVCLECGAKQKMLKRHLQAAHGLSPDEYRQRYNLSATYPMVASNYAEVRSQLAKELGLGSKGTKKAKASKRKGGKGARQAKSGG